MEQTDKQKQVRSQIIGIAGTLLFHGLLVLLFILLVFHTPIPPWPEEGGGGGGSGLEINLGNSDDGMFANESAPISIPDFENNKVSQTVEPPMDPDIKSANTDAEDVLAQDNEESVAVPAKPENVKKKVEKDNTIKQPVKPEVVVKPVVNPNSLYKKKTTTDGTTGKPGNQGREDGKTGAGNYGGTGTGSGTGDGSGTGSGSGSGSGSGTGGGKGGGMGDGNSYDLGGRQTRGSLQKPFYNSPEQGKIVVSIKVNKQGKVTYASAGAKGTNISEISLRKQAEDAALKTAFAPDDNAPEEQRGTITYVFKKVR